MDRTQFHKLFKCSGPAVLPVVHVMNYKQTKRNVQVGDGLLRQEYTLTSDPLAPPSPPPSLRAQVAISEGAQGVFLINHDFSYHQLLPIIRQVREDFPYLWLGVNFLGVTGTDTGMGGKREGCLLLSG